MLASSKIKLIKRIKTFETQKSFISNLKSIDLFRNDRFSI